MRFIGALGALGPIVAVLDALPAPSIPTARPRDILSLLAAWLGVDLDESQEIRHRREMVRRAADLGRKRGTVAGMELALKLAYPDVPLRIEDEAACAGRSTSTRSTPRLPPSSSPTATSPPSRRRSRPGSRVA